MHDAPNIFTNYNLIDKEQYHLKNEIFQMLINSINQNDSIQSFLKFTSMKINVDFFFIDYFQNRKYNEHLFLNFEEDFELEAEPFNYFYEGEQNIISKFSSLSENKVAFLMDITSHNGVVGKVGFLFPSNYTSEMEIKNVLLYIKKPLHILIANSKKIKEIENKHSGFFLEQILNKNYDSKKEILYRAQFLNLDLTRPYYIVLLDCLHLITSYEESYAVSLLLIRYFKNKNLDVLICRNDDYMILLVSAADLEDQSIYKAIVNLLEYVKVNTKLGAIKGTISSKKLDIEDVNSAYEETSILFKYIGKKNVATYKDIGMLHLLITRDESKLREYGEFFLKDLINKNDEKMKEYLKTLYVYLTYGGKLQNTMNDLLLSKSGLIYRLVKIEEILQIDLRNPQISYQLLLLLDLLIMHEIIYID